MCGQKLSAPKSFCRISCIIYSVNIRGTIQSAQTRTNLETCPYFRLIGNPTRNLIIKRPIVLIVGPWQLALSALLSLLGIAGKYKTMNTNK